MDGQNGMDGASALVTSSAQITNGITGDVIGESTLYRQVSGIFVDFEASGLEPNYAYTLWLVVWNNPENCAIPGECAEEDFTIADQVEVEALFGTGGISNTDGTATFTVVLEVGDDSGSINESIFGLPAFGGLQNAMTAEIHPILRSHGPVIPGEIANQISSFEGGCTEFFPPFTEIPDIEGECGDIAFALHRL